MLTAEQLEERRDVIETAPDLCALRDALAAKLETVLARDPAPPALKALLSMDGGICPDDHTPLVFDPWQADRHRCPACGKSLTGERHRRSWAWHQHLWLAERLAQAATLGVLADHAEAAAWAARGITRYRQVYFGCPNQDNVLGPARLFFSTYLESIWLTQFATAAYLLREGNLLDQDALEAADAILEEAANLIGEFDEGLSNRQTWNNAALAAAAVWFEDADLAQRAIEGARGLVGHLVDGFLPDGLWYEGENYHLFALRGLLTGGAWSRLAGVDLFAAEASIDRLAAALNAPTLTVLPDGCFPARKDSRFGVSLAQPMYLELWEAGVATLLEAGRVDQAEQAGAWLRSLYRFPAPPAQLADSYLHEAGDPAPASRSRHDLSAWMLCAAAPELPGAEGAWTPRSVLLPDQGLAVLRAADTYVSVECGPGREGHGHPDRLHLTLHSGGVHWCPDPGTGSYVSPDLTWFRSTLAHNAPRLDGTDQAGGDAECTAFDDRGRWGWVVGSFGGFTRTTVLTPTHLLDQLEFAADHEHLVELPWHFQGEWEVESPGRWEAGALEGPLVERVRRFVPSQAGPVRLRVRHGQRELGVVLGGEGEVVQADGPGVPGSAGPQPFLLRRHRGRYVRFLAVLGLDPATALTGFAVNAAEITVETSAGTVVHRPTTDGWAVLAGEERVNMGGRRRPELRVEVPIRFPVGPQVLAMSPLAPATAVAVHAAVPPALDGTLAGFATDAPLTFDHDDQYRRSEMAYPGPEEFAATAWLNWDEEALYLAVDVRHHTPVFRSAAAPPLLLDNEPDDIHSDGLQVYVQVSEDDRPAGYLIVPEEGGRLRASPAGGFGDHIATIRGAWQRTGQGYLATLALRPPGWPPSHLAGSIRFDLLVNEMRPGRERRAGQLVWSGGGGWVYLQGDRRAPARFGTVTLA